MQVIAEVGLAHDGSLNLAHAFVDAIADVGADGVKFQCHLPEESSGLEQWRTEWSAYGEARLRYWTRTSFTREQWIGLAVHAHRRGLLCGCSVFCPQAVTLLAGVVDFWKVPSGMVGHRPMLEAIAQTKTPTYLSNGLQLPYPWWSVLPDAIEMKCVSSYPTPLEQCPNLTEMGTLTRAGQAYGLSDHSGTIWPALFACTWAVASEVHVTFDRAMGGPDAASSLTMAELQHLCTGVRAFTQMGTVEPEPSRHASVYEPSILNGVWMKTSGQAGEPPSTAWPTHAQLVMKAR